MNWKLVTIVLAAALLLPRQIPTLAEQPATVLQTKSFDQLSERNLSRLGDLCATKWDSCPIELRNRGGGVWVTSRRGPCRQKTFPPPADPPTAGRFLVRQTGDSG